MIRIKNAELEDAIQLTELARDTFVASHSASASSADIEKYLNGRLSLDAIESDLKNEKNRFHLIFCGEALAGFSKLVPDSAHEMLASARVCLAKPNSKSQSLIRIRIFGCIAKSE